MAIDLTTPIDITAVIGAVKKHKDLLVTLDAESAHSILQHFTPIPGIKDSLTLGRTELGRISHRYTGKFIGQKEDGKIVPRTLKVYPCVMEMDDEPERYRRTYITEVKGGFFPKEHPFEIWLNNYGIKCASKELHDVCLMAAYSADDKKTSLADSFDGPYHILEAEKTAGNISTAKGNMFSTGVMTAANVGDALLSMWRDMPSIFRQAGGDMMISHELGDLYDDWLDNQGTLITGSGAETAGEQYLRNTGKKCRLIRMTGMPAGSQFVLLTQKWNRVYGYDSDADFRRLVPFASGNPYHYTAAGKYALGFQFVTLDKSVLRINDQPVTPVASGGTGDTETGA